MLLNTWRYTMSRTILTGMEEQKFEASKLYENCKYVLKQAKTKEEAKKALVKMIEIQELKDYELFDLLKQGVI